MGRPLKHRWSLGHNFLAGITFDNWWRLLRENRFDVDAAYWHRAAFVTVLSALNSWWRRKEDRLYRETIARTVIAEPPLFILGHWRSGTTHLHNLIAQDREQFAFPNTYQVVNPSTFLCTEAINSRRFARLLPDRRPMDNVALSFQAPQEDEIAPCLLTLRSLYLGLSFPRREDHYGRYLTFRDVPRAEVEEWKAGFRWFIQKLTLKCGRAIVLKSPPHTARIRLLLELFPDARFVHIHREPYTVFQSCQHYFDTAGWYAYLQKPDLATMDDRIIRRYSVTYDAFFAERKLIPPERLCEVGYEELERDPVSQVRYIYEQLRLSGFNQFEPQLRAYLDSLKGYEKNRFISLDDGLRHRVGNAWRRTFEEWNYPQ
jgi:hypothetical protein